MLVTHKKEQRRTAMSIPILVLSRLASIQTHAECIIGIADNLIADDSTPLVLKAGYLTDVRRCALRAYNDAATLRRTNDPQALD